VAAYLFVEELYLQKKTALIPQFSKFFVKLLDNVNENLDRLGDTVLDPFMGTGTTNVAAAKWGRNSIGVEVDPKYFEMSVKRIDRETPKLLAAARSSVSPSATSPLLP
jgi:DNA modification methylase